MKWPNLEKVVITPSQGSFTISCQVTEILQSSPKKCHFSNRERLRLIRGVICNKIPEHVHYKLINATIARIINNVVNLVIQRTWYL